jgi:hypothetical protein
MFSTLAPARKDLALQTDSARMQDGELTAALAAPHTLWDASRMACAVAGPRAAGPSSKKIVVPAAAAPVLAASVREFASDKSTGSVAIRLLWIASDPFKQVHLDLL